jgi:hypothetical protein
MTTDTVTITLDRAAWAQGFRDAEAGRRARPGALDGLAYHSGYIEGAARREFTGEESASHARGGTK